MSTERSSKLQNVEFEIASRTTLASWLHETSGPEFSRAWQTAMRGAGRGLSAMLGHPICITPLWLGTVPLAQIAAHTGDPETEMVGIYMLIEGDLSGQAILTLSLTSALNLVGMLLDTPPGTAARLGQLERSALAEVGNLMVSYFLMRWRRFWRDRGRCTRHRRP